MSDQLDPQVRALLAQFADKPPLHVLPVDIARRGFKAATTSMIPPGPPVLAEDRTIEGPGGPLGLRIYRPSGGAAGRPLVVYFHGGGWVIGDLDTHDPVCRALCAGADAVVVSVDYRLAPEHRFPAAPDDSEAATRWAVANAAALGADPSRVVLAGDSAGGNLAAVVALRLRDGDGPRLSGQLLLYPVTDHYGAAYPSYETFAEGYGLTRTAMQWFWDHYLGAAADDALSPHAAPQRAPDLRGLPPALVLTAGHDVLRDEGEAYAARLREAGVDAVLERHGPMHHGFFSWCGVLDGADRAVARACGWIVERTRR
jgi:acetyl esterase